MKQLSILCIFCILFSYAFAQTNNPRRARPQNQQTENQQQNNNPAKELATSDVVKIGNQVWMTKNLEADKFRNGDALLQAKTEEEWMKADDEKKPAWCYYDNDPSNGTKYGKLYNWWAVSDPRGLAPKGYHIPSDAEQNQLIEYLGVMEAGTKMKSAEGWNENGNGSNASGFTGLPGGYRDEEGFDQIGSFGSWWSSKENSTKEVQLIFLSSKSASVIRYNDFAEQGASVRCIKD